MQDMNERLVGMQEASQRLFVTSQTIRSWYSQGLIRLFKMPSGRYRVPESEITRILAEGKGHEIANTNYVGSRVISESPA